MILLTAEEMRQADQRTIAEVGIPGMVLMENAAQGAVRILLEQVGPAEALDVAAFCGRGNNGGDGLACLRILANRGAAATAYLFCRVDDLKGDAATNLAIAAACGVEIIEIPDEDAFSAYMGLMAGHQVYLDALIGTGLNAPVSGRMASAIELLNGLGRPILAIDIPSGLSADTGQPLGPTVAADWTAAFGALKLGLALEPGDFVGELSLVDISIPPQVIADLEPGARLLDADQVADLMPDRPLGGHKGTFGHLLVLGGSPGKSGAICLAAMGGLRAGAGLVTVALPRGLNLVAEIKLTAAMSHPLEEDAEGLIDASALPTILDLCAQREALILGPGLGVGPGLIDLVSQVVTQVDIPMVIDADALTALKGRLGSFSLDSEIAVLTPHPGEMARLLETSVPQVLEDRPRAARRLARETEAVVVLKGAKTIVAHPSGHLWVNPTGNPLLASGGSGDVLAGVIAGLMAQGSQALAAACTGVFVHGLAAHLAGQEYGRRGLAAEDLADILPAAFAQLEPSPAEGGPEAA